MTASAENLLEAVASCLEGSGPHPLHEPVLGEAERMAVSSCVESGWVSSMGPQVSAFEDALAEVTGSPHAVAVVNGTCALHLALMLAGVRRDDEVIVPAMTFVATANAVSYLGAVPHLADCEETGPGLDPEKLDAHLESACARIDGRCVNKTTGRTVSAVVPVHSLGLPPKLDQLTDVARRHGLVMVEDAAPGLGTTLHGRHAGTFGSLGILSFNGNKIVTTGGGGAVLTADPELAARARHISSTARTVVNGRPLHDQVGFNYRMPNLNAALGLAQMRSLTDFLERKRRLAVCYRSAFADMPGVRLLEEPHASRYNYWLVSIVLEDESGPETVRRAIELAAGRGLGIRGSWPLLDTMPMYADCPSMDLGRSRRLADRLLSLPSGAGLSLKDGHAGRGA